MNKSALALIITLTAGCATTPSGLPTTYASPLQYKTYTCNQLIEEMDRISRRGATLHSTLDQKAGNDGVQLTIGMLLFWPALFLLEGGDGPDAVEYSNLKGEFEAMKAMVVQKNCTPGYMPLSFEELSNQKRDQTLESWKTQDKKYQNLR